MPLVLALKRPLLSLLQHDLDLVLGHLRVSQRRCVLELIPPQTARHALLWPRLSQPSRPISIPPGSTATMMTAVFTVRKEGGPV
jgi:hypothetical protein